MNQIAKEESERAVLESESMRIRTIDKTHSKLEK